MDLQGLSLDELAELLKGTHDGPSRKQIVQEIGKRKKAGDVMQESHVTQGEKSSLLLGVGVLVTLVAAAGVCVLVLIL